MLVLEGENGGTMPNSAGRADEVVSLDVLGHDGQAYANQEYVVIVDNEYTGMAALQATGAFIIVTDFDGSLENGSMSVALVNDTGFVEDVDYDSTNNDGIGALDGYTLGTDYEAVGFREQLGDTVYGVDLTIYVGGDPDGQPDPDIMLRDGITGNWEAGEATDYTATPGALNDN